VTNAEEKSDETRTQQTGECSLRTTSKVLCTVENGSSNLKIVAMEIMGTTNKTLSGIFIPDKRYILVRFSG
jgi:hypothetical protein